MTNSKGFTIIELLIVVAILGILAAIAIPSVTKYTTNARRADGKTALLAAAQAMERHYTNNYTYVGATIGSATTDLIPENSDSGYYILSFTTNGTNPAADKFEIQAEGQGKQAGDTACQIMTIDQLGRKTPSGCW
ncbi:type IV pilin protein [Desulfonatronum sp. SC1]|uniref:type IV pilin protein n=1 Tax=Desulfonatronum sp. SC1 TaxID=2109626 RepID=UPI000D316C84|nr:type IV pilin protein [Desulfonatronum sp. SC1]PTN34952.1 hypothetical protein C6366_12450 [Desulfonatronum sp. SC1]